VELKNKKIVFCFPYKDGPGGVNMLFLRLATFLKKNGYDTAIIDYKDGDMSNNRQSSLPLIEYHDDKKVVIPPNSIVILQSMTPWSIFPSLEISDNSRVFFITTLPHNFFPILPGKLRNIMSKGQFIAKIIWKSLLSSEYFKIRRFISIADRKHALVFLDSDIACNVQKSLNIDIESPRLLPLFSKTISRVNLFLTGHKFDESLLKVGWVGRIADFKINILNKVITDAFHYSNNHKQKIVFHVVGYGECSKQLINYKSEYFSIERVDYIKPSQLSKYMLKLDMVFLMGTTALDSSRIGVPTVRLDYGFSKISDDYLYKMIYEVSGFSLGENLDGRCFSKGRHSFDTLMESIKKDRFALSRKCFDYYIKNHSIENSAKIFINYVTNSNLKWGDLRKERVLQSIFYNFWKIFKNKFKEI
jgi:hypothetical protein